MNKTKWITLTTAAVLLAGGFTLTTLHAQTPGAGRRGGQFLQRAAEHLNLSEDQLARIKTELAGEKESTKALLGKLREARIGLRDAIRAKDATEKSVRAAAAKVAVVEADLAVLRFKVHGKIFPVLTDEQREKAAQFEEQVDGWVERALERFGEQLENK